MNNICLLNGVTVNPKEIDPSKHKFIGLFRTPTQPDTSYIDEEGNKKFADIYLCPCGQHLWTVGGIFQHWQAGHMDMPQYVNI